MWAAICVLASALGAETPLFPLKDVKPGLRGTGKSVFSGSRVEEFQAEILGVLENIGPKQALILARLSGGPLDRAGVMQGMSGSPVYVQGKLLGAVAMAFPFAKEPIAGIRPIEEMLPVGAAGPAMPARGRVTLADRDLTRLFPRREEIPAGQMKLADVATPVSFGGFTRATVEHFAPELRAIGLEPQQGISGGGRAPADAGPPQRIQPGSMISVQLMTGDMTVGADGTVTHIEGNRVYAFGHRFLSVGATALPFARAEVVALLPTLQSSFKISVARESLGAISQDRNTAVFGELGKTAPMVPLAISISRAGRRLEAYKVNMVDDQLLSPLLLQMAVFSVIDATERTVGPGSFRLTGAIEFENAAPIQINNMYSADNGSAQMVSLNTAVPLAYVLQSGFRALRMKRVNLAIDTYDAKNQLQIDQVWTGRREVRPGDTVELTTVLNGENGVEVTRSIKYTVPVGAPPGPLSFTVADAATTNLAELRQTIFQQPRSAAQLIRTVNALRGNTKAYVRVWRPDAAFQLEGSDLPGPPASVALVLGVAQPGSGGITQTRNSKVAEFELSAGDMVISGSKTVQVEIKE